jgi:hypothetical protein
MSQYICFCTSDIPSLSSPFLKYSKRLNQYQYPGSRPTNNMLRSLPSSLHFFRLSIHFVLIPTFAYIAVSYTLYNDLAAALCHQSGKNCVETNSRRRDQVLSLHMWRTRRGSPFATNMRLPAGNCSARLRISASPLVTTEEQGQR